MADNLQDAPDCDHKWCHVDKKLHPSAEKCIYCGCPNTDYKPGDHPFESRAFGSPYCLCNRPFDAPEHTYAPPQPRDALRGSVLFAGGKLCGFPGDSVAADVMDAAIAIRQDEEDWRERGIDGY